MNDDVRDTTHPETPPHGTAGVKKKSRNGVLWGLLAVVLAFLIGFGWQFYRATTIQGRLDAAEQELLVERLRVQLAQAAIAAQSGDFESARQDMSEFFTAVGEARIYLPPAVADVADEFLDMRDDVITGLSRSNPEYADVLYGMLERFRNAAEGEIQAPTPDRAAPSVPPPPGETTGGAGGGG